MSAAEDRLEQGLLHHPVAVAIYDLLWLADMNYSGDRFGWKAGGDGDNGETLMAALSALFAAAPDKLAALQRAIGAAPQTPTLRPGMERAGALLQAEADRMRRLGNHHAVMGRPHELVQGILDTGAAFEQAALIVRHEIPKKEG